MGCRGRLGLCGSESLALITKDICGSSLSEGYWPIGLGSMCCAVQLSDIAMYVWHCQAADLESRACVTIEAFWLIQSWSLQLWSSDLNVFGTATDRLSASHCSL